MDRYSRKTEKFIATAGTALFLIIFTFAAIKVGKPMIEFASEPEKFREFIDRSGVSGRLIFIGMTVLQVIVATIPGEPLEIAAGYAFGVIEGTVLTLIGITIGSTLVFLLVRTLGAKIIRIFFSDQKTSALRRLTGNKKFTPLLILALTMPGTPKDILTYFAGLSDIKLTTWIIITPLLRIPSVITSTVGGSALGVMDYKFAVIVFCVTMIISIAGYIIYGKITAKRNEN